MRKILTYAKNYLCKGTQILKTVGSSEAEVRGGALCRDCEKGGGGVPQGKMEIDFSHCALSRAGHTEHPAHYPELVTKGSEIRVTQGTATYSRPLSFTLTHTHTHPCTSTRHTRSNSSRAHITCTCSHPHSCTYVHVPTCTHTRTHTHT